MFARARVLVAASALCSACACIAFAIYAVQRQLQSHNYLQASHEQQAYRRPDQAFSVTSSQRDYSGQHLLEGWRKDKNKKLDFLQELPLLCLSFTVSAFANAAGVGGGAFFVPMFNLLVGFSLKGSTAMSQAVITGGSVVSVLVNSFKQHPTNPSQSLVDFDLALMLTPMLLFGVSLGVFLNVAFPNWLLTLLLVTLLTYLTNNTVRRGLRLYAKEVAAESGAADITPPGAQQAPTATNYQIPKRYIASLTEGIETPPTEGSRYTDLSAVIAAVNGSRRPGIYPEPSPEEGSTPDGQQAVTDTLTVMVATTESLCESETEGGSEVQMGHEAPPTDTSTSVISKHLQQRVLGSAGAESGMPARLSNLSRSSLADEASAPAPLPSTARAVRTEPHTVLQPTAHPLRTRHDMVQVVLKAALLFIIWVVFLGLSTLKGRFPRCSLPYYACDGLQLVLALCASGTLLYQAYRKHAAQQHERDAEAGGLGEPLLTKQDSEPSAWSAGSLLKITALMLPAGVICGLVGIGGGMIMGPMLLGLGVHPLAVAATCAVMVLFSSSSATYSFFVHGYLNVHYAAVYAAFCAGGSLFGVVVVGRIVKQSGRASIIVMMLAAIMATGALLAGVFGGMEAVQSIEQGKIGFHNVCEPNS